MSLKVLKSTITIIVVNLCFIVNACANGDDLNPSYPSPINLVKMSPIVDEDIQDKTSPLETYMKQSEGVDENGIQNIFKKSDFSGNKLRRYPTPVERQRLAHQKLIPQKDDSQSIQILSSAQEKEDYSSPEYDDMAAAFDPSDLKCMTQILYHEARGETYSGAVAVGNVVINRINNDEFPKTVCGVMKQKSGRSCQFSFVCNGRLDQVTDKASWQRSEKIAKQVLSGNAPDHGGNALFFHATSVSPGWFKKLGKGTRIGSHYFYD